MKKSKFITEFKDIPSAREKMPHIPLGERRENFREVELGFDEAGALKEAKRCLSCRRCIGCGLCLAECDPKAVVYDEKGKTLALKVNSIILTPGFDEFDAGRISELGYRKYPNVITSIELERMLAPTGPYGGYVLRPYDGRVPEKIAFIQCVGSRNEAIGADFCSSICCMTAMKEALALTTLISDSRVTILHRDMRPLGKGSEEFYQSVLKEKRIKLVRGPVARITEVAESRNLTVEFSSNDGTAKADATQGGGAQGGVSQAGAGQGTVSRRDAPEGGPRTEEYDLVVLSVGVRAAGKALSRKTGVRLNKYGFCTIDSLNPGVTSKAGILSAGSFTAPMDIPSSVCQADAAAAVALRSLVRAEGMPGSVVGGPPTGTASVPEGVTGPGAQGVAAKDATSIPVASTAVLVIGSGLAGLVAANELARMGHDVLVVEKEKNAGGTLSRYEFKLDEKSEKDVVSALLEAVKGNPKIRIFTSTELSKFFGDAGEFSVAFMTDAVGNTASDTGTSKPGAGATQGKGTAHAAATVEKFGAVVVCTGGQEHIPDGLMHGENARVLTQLEFGKALANGEIAKTLAGTEPATGGPPASGSQAGGGAVSGGTLGSGARVGEAAAGGTNTPSIVMVQCVGSRSSDWPVCSRVCCAQALRNALAAKKAQPNAKVTILHRDIRVYGLEEELLTEALEKGVEFVALKDSAALVPRGTSVEISSAPAKADGAQSSGASGASGGAGQLPTVAFQREGATAKETLQADYVVLSTGLRPRQEAKGLAEVLGLEVDSNGFFKELHPKLKPVETSRKGIYICGLAHSSQTVQETITQALAAAKKTSSALRRT